MVIHNPEMGYDAEDHLDYLITLPDRLPGPDDTRESFATADYSDGAAGIGLGLLPTRHDLPLLLDLSLSRAFWGVQLGVFIAHQSQGNGLGIQRLTVHCPTG
jgi:hypothetical protein